MSKTIAYMKTSQMIANLLDTNNLAVERAIIVIYERQTYDEQRDSTTKHLNDRGFSASTARVGTYFARWIRSGQHLTGNHLSRARGIAKLHIKQLVEAANQKAALKAA